MHHFAERKKYNKQIGKEHMKNQHKRMPGIRDLRNIGA